MPRILATGSLVTVATAYRVATSCAGLVGRRALPLVGLAVQGSVGTSGAARAQVAFRDELLSLARDSAEVSWRELRRGVDDLDVATRPAAELEMTARRRPHRVKR